MCSSRGRTGVLKLSPPRCQASSQPFLLVRSSSSASESQTIPSYKVSRQGPTRTVPVSVSLFSQHCCPRRESLSVKQFLLHLPADVCPRQQHGLIQAGHLSQNSHIPEGRALRVRPSVPPWCSKLERLSHTQEGLRWPSHPGPGLPLPCGS